MDAGGGSVPRQALFADNLFHNDDVADECDPINGFLSGGIRPVRPGQASASKDHW